MLDLLLELDKVLFLIINGLCANPVTDTIMPILTNDSILKAVFLLIIIGLLWKGDQKQRWLILFAGITMVITDQTSAGLLKPLIERARPCYLYFADDINLLVGCGSGYAMPSAHAANVFGQAALISMYVRFSKWPLYIFAFLVAISRVFVGVHYPADIIVGALIGYLAGKIIGRLFDTFNRKILIPPQATNNHSETLNDQPNEAPDASST